MSSLNELQVREGDDGANIISQIHFVIVYFSKYFRNNL